MQNNHQFWDFECFFKEQVGFVERIDKDGRLESGWLFDGFFDFSRMKVSSQKQFFDFATTANQGLISPNPYSPLLPWKKRETTPLHSTLVQSLVCKEIFLSPIDFQTQNCPTGMKVRVQCISSAFLKSSYERLFKRGGSYNKVIRKVILSSDLKLIFP